MEILRIPTHYRSQMEYMSNEDRGYILLSLMRLSEGEIIEIEQSMRGGITISIWKEACQLEKKARKGKGEEYNEVDPIISYGTPSGCTLRDTPEIYPKSTQINPNQPKSTQSNPIQPNPNQNSSKEEGSQAIVIPDINEIEEKKEYGNHDINKTLAFLTKHIGCDTFAESQKLQRQYAKHILNLGKEIGADEMKYRIDKILEDKFKAKNANKIAFIYKELKSFIHAPEPEIFKC